MNSYSVSVCLSIEAENEDAAMVEFERKINNREYESGSFDIELE